MQQTLKSLGWKCPIQLFSLYLVRYKFCYVVKGKPFTQNVQNHIECMSGDRIIPFQPLNLCSAYATVGIEVMQLA